MHTFTGEWDCVRFIRREVRHHRKHMLDDPPNMIDPINYVLLFCSIPLFKSFHVACMDNYVLKVTVIYLHLWWSCLVYWENAWKNKGPTQKKITGLFGNFSQHGGGGLLNSQNFCKLTKCFFVCQIHSEVLKHVLQRGGGDIWSISSP